MNEIRNCELRTLNDESQMILTGTPIVFNSKSFINNTYYEIITRNSVDNISFDNIKLLYNHNADIVPLANTPNTLSLTIDDIGIHMRAVLPNTEKAKEIYTAVKRGDLSGMSFAFTVPSNGDTYDAYENLRTINKIDKIYEISIVPFPAYAETSVEARAMMNSENHKALEKEKILHLLSEIDYYNRYI